MLTKLVAKPIGNERNLTDNLNRQTHLGCTPPIPSSSKSLDSNVRGVIPSIPIPPIVLAIPSSSKSLEA